jgi:hypothetical protein
MGPLAYSMNAGVERRGLEFAEGQDGIADTFENSHEVIDVAEQKLGLPRTCAEEGPGVSRRLRAGLH